MQNDMTLSNDSFLATITNLEVTLKDQLFNIRVIPLIKRTEPFVCETKTPLTQKHLDASQLAGLTNSNPIYFLVDVPKHGKIMRIVRPSGSRSKVIMVKERQSAKDSIDYLIFKQISFLKRCTGSLK